MQKSLSITAADISVHGKNDHTVPDQQLGCPESCLGSNVSCQSVRKWMCHSNLTRSVCLNPSTQSHLKILWGWSLKPGFGMWYRLMIAPHLDLKFWNVSENNTQAQENVSHDSRQMKWTSWLPVDEQFNLNAIICSGSLALWEVITQISTLWWGPTSPACWVNMVQVQALVPMSILPAGRHQSAPIEVLTAAQGGGQPWMQGTKRSYAAHLMPWHFWNSS